jgi:ribonucleoside-diphosphate reductase alpha chain
VNNYQQFIHLSRYARYREDLGRRETWDETVDRVYNFWLPRTPKSLHKDLKDSMEAVRRMEIMPSMRVMMTAGPALEKHNVAGYNCSYTPVDHPKKFSEILYILNTGS